MPFSLGKCAIGSILSGENNPLGDGAGSFSGGAVFAWAEAFLSNSCLLFAFVVTISLALDGIDGFNLFSKISIVFSFEPATSNKLDGSVFWTDVIPVDDAIL